MSAPTVTTIIGRSHRGGIRFTAPRAVAEVVRQFHSIFGDVQYDNERECWETYPTFPWEMDDARYRFLADLILAIHNEINGTKMAVAGAFERAYGDCPTLTLPENQDALFPDSPPVAPHKIVTLGMLTDAGAPDGLIETMHAQDRVGIVTAHLWHAHETGDWSDDALSMWASLVSDYIDYLAWLCGGGFLPPCVDVGPLWDADYFLRHTRRPQPYQAVDEVASVDDDESFRVAASTWRSLLTGNVRGHIGKMIEIGIVPSQLLITRLDREDLSGANLSGANLRWCSLKGADLGGSSLDGANLQGVNMAGANLDGATLRDAYLITTNLEGASLWRADLTGANALGANLSCAHLESANLYKATLRGANLAGACLWGATLDDADMIATNLGGAIMRRASMRNTALYAARVDATTQMPPDVSFGWPPYDGAGL